MGHIDQTDDDFEDLFENAPCAYVSLAPDGRIVRSNRTFASWTGYEAESLVGRPFHNLLSVAGRIFYETHFAPLLRMQGFFDEVALDLVIASGAHLPVLANARERRDASGGLSFIRLALFRASDRRRYERDLVSSQESTDAENKTLVQSLAHERDIGELREQFIAVLGHDLRNPLASIEGGARLLMKEPLSDRAASVVALMRGSVIRMSGLIDNILDFARGRLGGGISLDRTPIDLEPILDQVVSELRSSMPDREIRTEFSLSSPVHVDAQRIAQLVSNLLANALVHGLKSSPVIVEASTNADGFSVSVTNEGTPIPEATREHLFQPFFRGDARHSQHGLGLGLHIASEIAKAHGGTLTVASDDEQTRFTLTVVAAP